MNYLVLVREMNVIVRIGAHISFNNISNIFGNCTEIQFHNHQKLCFFNILTEIVMQQLEIVITHVFE